MKSIKTVVLVFLIAFGLNLIWEGIHSNLYLHYQGQEITWLILLRATLFDAVFTLLIFFIAQTVSSSSVKSLLVISLSLTMSIGLEIFALQTNRWAYGPSMPIIPFLEIGLTPVIQLPLLVYLTFRLAKAV